MNTTQTTPSASPRPPAPAIGQPETLRHRGTVESVTSAPALSPRRAGYGLPCAKCKTYYPADLAACPVCRETERVSPVVASALSAPSSQESPEVSPEVAALEAERERFLREFKSQVYASHLQVNAAASFRCTREENHQGGHEPAAVCQGCYDRLQERVDLMEAALHMDLKEATQLVYDAVWSDPSDPGKTYHNAAQALMTEVRRRAGISAVLGPLQTLPH